MFIFRQTKKVVKEKQQRQLKVNLLQKKYIGDIGKFLPTHYFNLLWAECVLKWNLLKNFWQPLSWPSEKIIKLKIDETVRFIHFEQKKLQILFASCFDLLYIRAQRKWRTTFCKNDVWKNKGNLMKIPRNFQMLLKI